MYNYFMKFLNIILVGKVFYLVSAIVFVLGYISSYYGILDAENIINNFNVLLEKYGLWSVFFVYIIEGLFLISFYFPGSFVILVATLTWVSLERGLWEIWFILNLSSMFVIVINYYLGYSGFYKILLRIDKKNRFSKFKRFSKKYGIRTIPLTSLHINWLSLSVVAFSSLRAFSLKTIFFLILFFPFYI